jgi:ADP-heptose:LPS heptosyltransferase
MRMNHSGGLPKHWLAFRLGHLGDVILSTGPLACLAQTQGWTFSYMARAAFAPVFDLTPHVNRVIALDESQLAAPAFLRLCRQLAVEYADYGLLDLHGSIRSALLSAFWKGPVLRYEKMSLERRLFLLSHGRLCGEKLRALNVPQRYFMAAGKALGLPPPPRTGLLPRVWLSEQEERTAVETLDRLFGAGNPPIVLHPYATHTFKAWPEEHWRELARLLDARDLPWMVIGSGKKLFPHRKEDKSNETTLRESFALLSRSRLLITGDSGPMHMASAVGTPVLALFGPTTEEWGFFPAGSNDRVLESADVACRPCSLHGSEPCPYNRLCMASITPEMVAQYVF